MRMWAPAPEYCQTEELCRKWAASPAGRRLAGIRATARQPTLQVVSVADGVPRYDQSWPCWGADFEVDLIGVRREASEADHVRRVAGRLD